jgi:threonine dehydratase
MQEIPTAAATPWTDKIDLAAIEKARNVLGERIVTTPLVQSELPIALKHLGRGTELYLKLELMQRSGSFKVRAAFLNMLRLSPTQREAGVVAASAGNHAIAVAYVASALGCSAKLVMFGEPNERRRRLCLHYGAEIVVANSPADAFDRVESSAATEQRTPIPPFEGPGVALGTATIGLELCRQVSQLDAVIVPVGGGGLAGGLSAAVKACWPECDVYGVEPHGAATIQRSLVAGCPRPLDRIDTIADSLGAPRAMPFSFELCRRNIKSIELVRDSELKRAMRLLAEDFKLAVEPAGAAALAALMGPLGEKLQGRRVGLIISGSNIDAESFSRLLCQ